MLTARQRQDDCDGVPALAGAPFSLALPAAGPIVLAVSGGGDSMAMLHLVHRALMEKGETGRLSVATVDHGLRAESAEEAAFVKTVCNRLGLPHRKLCWEGAKPSTGLQAAARNARYRLLSRLAAEAGATILVAHTAEDQAETLAMRGQRNASSSLGLAGMAEAIYWRSEAGGAWVRRPFLTAHRQALRDWLAEQRLDYRDDPSNRDSRFERIRIRQSAFDPHDMLLAAERHATDRQRSDAAIAAFIAAKVHWQSRGVLRVQCACDVSDPENSAVEALRALLAFVGQREHRPSARAVRGLLRNLSASRRGSLARCVIERDEDALVLYREHRRNGAAKAAPDTPMNAGCHAPHPFASAVPIHDLRTARQVERLCEMPLTPDPAKIIRYHNAN